MGVGEEVTGGGSTGGGVGVCETVGTGDSDGIGDPLGVGDSTGVGDSPGTVVGVAVTVSSVIVRLAGIYSIAVSTLSPAETRARHSTTAWPA